MLVSCLLVLLVVHTSCNKGPKVISLDQDDIILPTVSDGVFSEESNAQEINVGAQVIDQDLHTVQILETLPTEKYVYAKVKEDDATFWIATVKTEIEIGQSYYYKGSVLQTNFESKEYNRTFEEVFFVSEIIPSGHGMSYNESTDEGKTPGAIDKKQKPSKNIVVKGSVQIADLIANPEKYGGETIQISGECVKVNNEIMGRNWIHLNDGSADEFDLVVTSGATVEVGQVLTFEGIVGLERDFGSGYYYDIIIEAAELVEE